MILVSACLLNHQVRYKGDGNPCSILMQYMDCGHFLPFCPECAGELPTPRPPAEIRGGSGQDVWQGQARVINNQGKDVTENFRLGAEKCAQLFNIHKITAIILKQSSPSCGSSKIYDGTFSGIKIPGEGVTSARLRQFNVPIYSEEDMNNDLIQQLIAQDM